MISPTAVIAYILEHGPVSHTSLETRAMTKHKLTRAQFDKLMSKVAKHYQISSGVKGDDVWYKKKVSRPKPAVAPPVLPPYPREDLGECPFKICFCAMWRADDDEIYNPAVHGHRPTCDSIKYHALYVSQHPRIRHLDQDTQTLRT